MANSLSQVKQVAISDDGSKEAKSDYQDQHRRLAIEVSGGNELNLGRTTTHNPGETLGGVFDAVSNSVGGDTDSENATQNHSNNPEGKAGGQTATTPNNGAGDQQSGGSAGTNAANANPLPASTAASPEVKVDKPLNNSSQPDSGEQLDNGDPTIEPDAALGEGRNEPDMTLEIAELRQD